MNEAHSLESILEKCRGHNSRSHFSWPAMTHEFSNTYAQMVPSGLTLEPKTVDISFRSIVGILFAQPTHKIVKDEILENLDYFHERSARAINFFLAGYGAYWPDGYLKDRKVVANVDGTDWFFSTKAFNSLVSDLEKSTNWEYSGECDLILLNVLSKGSAPQFDFNSCMVMSLERMHTDKAIHSIRGFFEDIFRKAGDGPTISKLSDSLAKKNSVKALQDFVGSVIPQTKPCIEAYNSLKNFAVKKVGKG